MLTPVGACQCHQYVVSFTDSVGHLYAVLSLQQHRSFDMAVFLLNHVAISLVSCSSAEVVECLGRNPCCSADVSGWALTEKSKRASITFAAGQRSGISRYEVPREEESLSDLWMGITIQDFQIAGILHDVTESLKSTVRWLQTTQPTSGGAVTADTNYCSNCVEISRPYQWRPDLPFLGQVNHTDLLYG